ncbi:SDR family NAD(P)-dependent oxidoreductase [Chitinophaga qingshengii]|uniref:SDR family oxidoreductase n=1 Tax=Chitinophaga qingshengii TaxID=1569794 RepID=A0ABR7TH29_9BACT|nr:SDR family oxidoreductase [Chitinophaga qingshengii]MBC9929795.1 SDR family oxidoreductase [Chitinophaga qingshengii]
MDLCLKGKTAVVTGASQGMGRAITKELALEGVKVLATGRNESLLASLREEVLAAGGVEPVILAQDFMTADAPQKIAEAAIAGLAQVDILINNAGRSVALPVIGADEDWTASFLLHFDRVRQLTQLLLPQMTARREGVILNVASTFELRTINASSVAKAAMVVWSKQLAGELGKYGIRVNNLQPGLIDTENIRPLFPGEEREKFATREIPLGDFGEVQDIADMVTFLVSPRAKYVTGTMVTVDGGLRYAAF